MLYRFTITALKPWREVNEYEGQIEGTLEGHALCCYAQLPSGEAWQRYHPGDMLEVDLWLERAAGEAHIAVEPAALPALQQLDGTFYQASGRVQAIDGELVTLESLFPLRVDLDITAASRHSLPTIHAGDTIRVQGVLKIDLEP